MLSWRKITRPSSRWRAISSHARRRRAASSSLLKWRAMMRALLHGIARERRGGAMDPAAAAAHGVEVEREHVDALLGQPIERVRGCGAHDDAPGPHREAVDRERVIVRMELDRFDRSEEHTSELQS